MYNGVAQLGGTQRRLAALDRQGEGGNLIHREGVVLVGDAVHRQRRGLIVDGGVLDDAQFLVPIGEGQTELGVRPGLHGGDQHVGGDHGADQTAERIPLLPIVPQPAHRTAGQPQQHRKRLFAIRLEILDKRAGQTHHQPPHTAEKAVNGACRQHQPHIAQPTAGLAGDPCQEAEDATPLTQDENAHVVVIIIHRVPDQKKQPRHAAQSAGQRRPKRRFCSFHKHPPFAEIVTFAVRARTPIWYYTIISDKRQCFDTNFVGYRQADEWILWRLLKKNGKFWQIRRVQW